MTAVETRLGSTVAEPEQDTTSTPTLEVARRFADAAEQGRLTVDDIFADDVVYLVPGRSRVAGLHRGRAPVGAALSTPPGAPAGTSVDGCQTTELMVTGDRAVVILRLEGSTDGRAFVFEAAFHLQVTDGRIAAITEYSGDQYTSDRIIGT